MISAKISLKDMEGFDEQLSDVIEAIGANLEQVASYVEKEAKATSAFVDRSGKLRKSIKKKKSKFEGGGFLVFTKAPHSHLVEFGHVLIAYGKITGKRVPPHPFMRPALAKGIQKAVGLFRGNK